MRMRTSHFSHGTRIHRHDDNPEDDRHDQGEHRFGEVPPVGVEVEGERLVVVEQLPRVRKRGEFRVPLPGQAGEAPEQSEGGELAVLEPSTRCERAVVTGEASNARGESLSACQSRVETERYTRRAVGGSEERPRRQRPESIEDVLAGLDPGQIEAVTTPSTLVAVIAGAGSPGQDAVLTSRIAFRIAAGTADAARHARSHVHREAARSSDGASAERRTRPRRGGHVPCRGARPRASTAATRPSAAHGRPRTSTGCWPWSPTASQSARWPRKRTGRPPAASNLRRTPTPLVRPHAAARHASRTHRRGARRLRDAEAGEASSISTTC